MERLSDRKEIILKHIVQSYFQSAEPVGSKRLLEISGMQVSSATIRNEMNELERLDYIAHPHTSAGRIPTDKGYRYYVDYLLAEQEQIDQHATKMVNDMKGDIHTMDGFFKSMGEIISVFAQQVGVVVFPAIDDLYFRYVNLIPLQGKRVLVVWTTMSGLIQEQIIHLSEPLTPEAVTQIANFMNQELVGMPFHSIEAFLLKRRVALKDSYIKLCEVAQNVVARYAEIGQQKKIWVEGRNRFLDNPEFQSAMSVKPLFEALDDNSQIAEIFGNLRTNDVQVTIGQENRYEQYWDCSIIRKNFAVNDGIAGTLAVLGPRRMNYDHIISVVDTVARVLSDTLRSQRYF